MNEPTKITRAEANEKIAEWFEPKPENASIESDFMSEGGYWALDKKPWRWDPGCDWCCNTEGAWHLLSIEIENRTVSELLDTEQAYGILHSQFEQVAKRICTAFLYATTGVRYEITD